MCRDIGWQSRYCFNSQYLNWKRPRPPSFPHPINHIFQSTNEYCVRILLRYQNKREKISPSSVNHEIIKSTLQAASFLRKCQQENSIFMSHFLQVHFFQTKIFDVHFHFLLHNWVQVDCWPISQQINKRTSSNSIRKKDRM